MYKYLIAALFVSQLAMADIADFSNNSTWSFTSSGGTGSGAATMNFDVTLPAGAVITGGILNLTESTIVNFPNLISSGCTPPASVTGFIQLNGCSDLPLGQGPFPDAFFADQITVDASGPGFASANLNGPPPLSIGSSFIPVNGVYAVSLFSQGSMEFTGWLDPVTNSGTPEAPSFSGSSQASGTLEVDFTVPAVVTPEPASYGFLLGGSLLCLIGMKTWRSVNSNRSAE